MNNKKDFKYFIRQAFVSGIKNPQKHFLFEEENVPNTETPPSDSEMRESVVNFLSTVEQALKFKVKLPIGANVINSEKNIDIAADKITNDLLNASVDAGAFSKSIQGNISKAIINIEKEVKNVAAKEQQKQELEKQQQEKEQEKNEPEATKESYKYSKNKYLIERDDPISVGSIKGILKFTSQDKIAEVIKKMSREDFLEFIDGLQKSALDALAKGIESVESSSDKEKEEGEEEGGGGAEEEGEGGEEEAGGGEEEKEGNLKLADL